jgi:ribosome-binding protein aMBF1 (putative translation factor)
MSGCNLCGRNNEGLSLFLAQHKTMGYIDVCQDCWKKLSNDNKLVCGTGSAGGSCPTCG